MKPRPQIGLKVPVERAEFSSAMGLLESSMDSVEIIVAQHCQVSGSRLVLVHLEVLICEEFLRDDASLGGEFLLGRSGRITATRLEPAVATWLNALHTSVLAPGRGLPWVVVTSAGRAFAAETR